MVSAYRLPCALAVSGVTAIAPNKIPKQPKTASAALIRVAIFFLQFIVSVLICLFLRLLKLVWPPAVVVYPFDHSDDSQCLCGFCYKWEEGEKRLRIPSESLDT